MVKFDGIHELKNGDTVRFVLAGKEISGKVIAINYNVGTVEIETTDIESCSIRMWVPYFLLIKKK